MGRVRVNQSEVEPYLESLAPEPRRRLRAAIRALARSGRPKGLNVRLLVTDDDGAPFYRLRIGPHRIVYSVHGPEVYVHRAFDRDNGHGWLEHA